MSLLMLQIMCLLFGQLARIISFPPSRTAGVIISFIVIKVEVTVPSYNVCCQVKIDSTFTAVARFMFNTEKFFAIEFITYVLT